MSHSINNFKETNNGVSTLKVLQILSTIILSAGLILSVAPPSQAIPIKVNVEVNFGGNGNQKYGSTVQRSCQNLEVTVAPVNGSHSPEKVKLDSKCFGTYFGFSSPYEFSYGGRSTVISREYFGRKNFCLNTRTNLITQVPLNLEGSADPCENLRAGNYEHNNEHNQNCKRFSTFQICTQKNWSDMNYWERMNIINEIQNSF